MRVRNLLVITAFSFRLNAKRTLFPAALLLLVIPLIYGTSGLDGARTADCLERMAALIGIPMFVPLLKPEQTPGMEAVVSLGRVPYQAVAGLRMGLSLLGTLGLLLLFEGCLCMAGCVFPVCAYTFRALAAAMTLGFPGLLASAGFGNTALGYLTSFGWYCAVQLESVGAAFRIVSNGVHVYPLLLLAGSGAAILFFSGFSAGRGWGVTPQSPRPPSAPGR